MSDYPDLKQAVASLLRFTPRSPQQIAEMLNAPLPAVANALLSLISEERIYTYLKTDKERLYLRKSPPAAPCLTDEEKTLRYESRSYISSYHNRFK